MISGGGSLLLALREDPGECAMNVPRTAPHPATVTILLLLFLSSSSSSSSYTRQVTAIREE